MKKIRVLAMTSAAMMSVAAMAPMTAYAAPASFRIPGKGMALVVGNNGNGSCSIEDILAQIGQIPGQEDCVQQPDWNRPVLPDGNRPILPDWNLPGQPDGNLPEGNLPGVPDIDEPEEELPGTPDTDEPENELPGGDTDQEGEELSFARQVVQLVNEERAKNGLSPLTIHTGAERAAQVRAQEIQSSFSHTRPNGSSFSTALTEAGVSYSRSGENIAYGQRTPAQVMDAWMNSSGHRANILNSSFSQIGVGYVESASGIGYWTQLFID